MDNITKSFESRRIVEIQNPGSPLDSNISQQLFDHVRSTFNLGDRVGSDMVFRKVGVIFNDRMTPPENRPAIGFQRFGMFYRLICGEMVGGGKLSPSIQLPPAVAYLSNLVPVFRTKRGNPTPQNLFMESVWMMTADQAQDFGPALNFVRSKMRGRYAIDTLTFGYPAKLNDFRDTLGVWGETAVKGFVSLDRDDGFVVYG